METLSQGRDASAVAPQELSSDLWISHIWPGQMWQVACPEPPTSRLLGSLLLLGQVLQGLGRAGGGWRLGAWQALREPSALTWLSLSLLQNTDLFEMIEKMQVRQAL